MFIVIKNFLKYLVVTVWIAFIFLLIYLFIFIPGCKPQYTCGYDPALYKTKDGLLAGFNDANIAPKKFAAKIQKFGTKNNFCIANGSMYKKYNGEYLVNIRMVKSDYSFYVFGTEKYNFGVNMKNINADIDSDSDIEKFCQLIYSHIDTDKIEHYYDTSKLCE